ncbi:hypothetical protein N665_0066s0059 [Sinapis alba]|nr:hypothetical protein N665_0066s0059 [Sinapis alba]
MENNQIMNAQPTFGGIRTDKTNRYLYDQLWKLCVGPLFELPIIGKQVYYFPQGHIEELVASSNDNLCQLKPILDISSKIQCNVINIKLKVETNTDEVYAKIMLLPCSPLTPSQEIVAKDLHDHVWKFKHVFKGTPKRHLFTSGWNEFAKEKSLAVGDAFNGESLVGVRKATPQQSNISSSVISKESMHHGLIGTASIAIKTKCMFEVFYKPKSSQFIVNCDKFIDAVNKKFNIGSRFTMKFEGRDLNEITYSGTIVKVEDFSINWKDSEWRSLQVQWDEAATIPRPNKVSPWEIKPLIPSSNIPNIKYLTSLPLLSYYNEANDSKISSGWLVSYAGPVMSKPNCNGQMVQSAKTNLTTDASRCFRLFGVDLTTSTKARDVLEPLDSYQKIKNTEIFEEEKLDQIQAGTSLTEFQRQEISFTTRSTKVHMESVVRTVDLTAFDGYNHMIVELEKLFNIKGKLQNQWKLTFKDNEGDMMLVGDDPWPEFCNTVKEIFILSK